MISFSINVCAVSDVHISDTVRECGVSLCYVMNCSDSVMQWSFKLMLRYGVLVFMDICAHVLLNKHRDNVKVVQFFEFSNIYSALVKIR